jgi:hypothetical protein
MKEKIIDHFTALGRFKLVFNPAIRVVKEKIVTLWIDEMYMVNMKYMVKISSLEDATLIDIDKLDELESKLLQLRLYSMVVQSKQKPAERQIV